MKLSKRYKLLLSLILCISLLYTSFVSVLTLAAPSNFSVYYNGVIINNGGSIHYQGNGAITIGIKVPEATDFYVTFSGPGTTGDISLTLDGGGYNEYSFSAPGGAVYFNVVADGIPLPTQIINYYHDTVLDPNAKLSYVSIKARVAKINNEVLTESFIVDYDGYTNTGADLEQVKKKLEDLKYNTPGDYKLEGELQVAVFVNGGSTPDGYYWAKSDATQLFGKYNWGALEYEVRQRGTWGETKYIEPKPEVKGSFTVRYKDADTYEEISGIPPILEKDIPIPASGQVPKDATVLEFAGYDKNPTKYRSWYGSEGEANSKAENTYQAPIQMNLTETQKDAVVYYYYKKKPPSLGRINVYQINIDTNGIIANKTLDNLELGKDYQVDITEITAPSGSTYQGSNMNYDGFKPDILSKQLEATVQTASLSESQKEAWVYFYYKLVAPATPTPSPTPTPTPKNLPPIAIINAPMQVEVGQNVLISGINSYDPDGKIVDNLWQIEGAVKAITGLSGNTWFDKTGTYTIELYVTDDKGANAYTLKTIKVVPPVPKANIVVTGDLKENRKVIISSEGSSGNEMYPIIESETKWAIIPILGGTDSDIKYEGLLNGNKKDILIKKAGQYKITLIVKNSLGMSGNDEKLITIVPDIPPIADISASAPLYRNSNNLNNATIDIYDMSYSTDNDYISSRTWKYAYDSDNDGDFSDETWKVFNSGNSTNVQLNVTDVGQYKIVEDIIEGFGQPTIPVFITQSDYKNSSYEKVVEVKNIAPITTFGFQKKRLVDISVLTDYTGSKLTNLNNSLNTLKTDLVVSNIDVNFNVIDGSNRETVGTVVTSKHIFDGTVGVDINNNAYGSLYTYPSKIPGNLKGIVRKGEIGFDEYAAYTYDGKLYGWGTCSDIAPWIPIEYGKSKIIEPKLYTDIDNVEDVELAGYNSLFVLKKDGTVYINGLGTVYNVIGNMTPCYFPFKRIPQLDGTKELISIDKGKTIFAIKKDGTLWVWGSNNCYQAANAKSDTIYGGTAVVGYQKVPGMDNTDRLFYVHNENYYTIFAIKKDGTIWTWGQYLECLGVGYDYIPYSSSVCYVTSPKQIPNLNAKDIKQISSHLEDSGKRNAYILKYDGTLWHFTSNGNIEKVTTLYNSKVISYYDSNGYERYKKVNEIAVADLKNIAAIWNCDNRSYIGQRSSFTYIQLNDGTVIQSGCWYWEDDYFYGYSNILLDSKFGGLLNVESVKSSMVENYTPRVNSDRYFIYISDGVNEDYTSGFGNYYSLGTLKKNLLNYLTDNNYATYSTSPATGYDYLSPLGKQELTIRNFVNGSVNGGGLFDSGQYQQILDSIKSKYPANLAATQYALVNDEIIYNTNYSDSENDPMISSRWKITHIDPKYFDNGYGIMSGSGLYNDSSVNSFSKVGKYEIIYSARDNPKNDNRFDNYKLWSNENLSKLTLFVHRRPTAQFNIDFTGKDGYGNYIPTIVDTSFDWDHTSRTDLGIKVWDWRYKDIESGVWNNGKPATISAGKTYMVTLKVQDLEGEWSLPFTKTIIADGVNLTPTVDANPTSCEWTNQNVTVTVTADDNGENDFSRVIYTSSTQTTEPGNIDGTMFQKVFPLTYTAEGIWYLHMRVFDKAGNTSYRYRGPYKIDKTAPAGTATPYEHGWTNQDVSMSFSPWDNLSGVQKWRYRATPNNDTTWGAWSGYAWGAVPSTIVFNYEGLHKLQAEVTDNAGNVGIVNSGSYLIDKTPPVIVPDITGPLEVFENITVNLSLSDNLSGVKETRYCFTNSTDKPVSGWNTSTSTTIPATFNQEGEWYLHVECEDNAGNISYMVLGKFTIIYVRIYDLTVTNINDITWRDYYFDGTDLDSNGKPKNYTRKSGTDIKASSMPINNYDGSKLVSYTRDGIDAGCEVNFYLRSKGTPENVAVIVHYTTDSGDETAVVQPVSSVNELWQYTYIVPLECKIGSYISFDIQASKKGKTYGSDYWFEPWLPLNSNRKIFYISGNALDRIKFNQSY